ncbi:MAG: hypothetical protein IJO75_01770 [Clostridia bacterium]|nr:hypothetical protein [Clostridia bacterium]
MSDHKIIKALEYCADPNRTCERCALYDPNDDDCECSSKLKRAAVAYIRFKDAVIECQEHTIQKLMNDEKASVAEARHGEWVYNPDGMDWNIGAWECSLCHVKNDNLGGSKGINPYRFVGGQYCPNCGAKMDGKGEDNAAD